MKTKTRIHEIIKTISANMPSGMLHSKPDGSFDIMQSQVADWIASELVADPEFLQSVFNKAREYETITFEPESKTWKGKNS